MPAAHRPGSTPDRGCPDNFPAIPVCAYCGNQIDSHGHYVVHYKRIVLERGNYEQG